MASISSYMPSGFSAKGNRLATPKFTKGIEYTDKSAMPETENIRQIVIAKDADRYCASIQYEVDEKPVKGSAVVGIDAGLKHFITISGGVQVEPLNALRKSEKKLKRGQRRSSRKRKGSQNRKKQMVKPQKIYQRVRDARTGFNHKVSTAIAKRYDTVVIEDLNIVGMVQNKYLSKKHNGPGMTSGHLHAWIQAEMEG